MEEENKVKKWKQRKQSLSTSFQNMDKNVQYCGLDGHPKMETKRRSDSNPNMFQINQWKISCTPKLEHKLYVSGAILLKY